jgi:hypothetical protein
MYISALSLAAPAGLFLHTKYNGSLSYRSLKSLNNAAPANSAWILYFAHSICEVELSVDKALGQVMSKPVRSECLTAVKMAILLFLLSTYASTRRHDPEHLQLVNLGHNESTLAATNLRSSKHHHHCHHSVFNAAFLNIFTLEEPLK